MKRFFYTLVMALLSLMSLHAAGTPTIHLNVAGTLNDSISTTEMITWESLKVTGLIDARDFKTIRDSLTALTSIDLEEADIVEYIGTEGTKSTSNYTYEANIVPWNALKNRTSLQEITLPANCIELATSALYKTSISDITIPDSVTKLGNMVFMYCSDLETITLGASFSTFSSSTFSHCNKLEFFNVSTANTILTDIDGIIYSADTTILKAYPQGKTDQLFEMPATVLELGNRAFQNVQCDSITLSPILEKIDDAAFQNTQFEKITLPASVNDIDLDYNIFAYNSNLKNIAIEEGNNHYCVIDGILFTGDTTQLMAYPPAKEDSSCHVPSPVLKLGSNAFRGALNLKEIILPQELQRLETRAFTGCTNLKSLHIPESVTYMNSYQFEYCSNLDTLFVYNETPITINRYTFYGSNSNLIISIPYHTDSSYQAATGWSYKPDSMIVARSEKDTQASPAAPTLASKTHSNITLEDVTGCEYAMLRPAIAIEEAAVTRGIAVISDDYEWQDSAIFENLDPDTEYSFIQRYAETNTKKASDISLSTRISTDAAVSSKDNKEPELLIYPNPASESITLSELQAGSLIELFDASGYKIMEKQAEEGASLNISHLNPGIYYIKVDQDIQKVIVE